MTLRELEIFMNVVDCENMSDAALDLHISQPTVSQAISQIEKEFNVKLFDRSAKKLIVTPTGKTLYRYSKELYSTFYSMTEFLENSAISKDITIGMSHSLPLKNINDLLMDFESQYKDLNIKLIIDDAKNILQKIEDSVIDIGIVDKDYLANDVVIKHIYSDEMVLIKSKNSKFKEEIKLKDIENEVFALKESELKNQFLNILRSKNINIKLKWTCSQNDSLFELVENGLAVSLMPEKRAIEKNISYSKITDLNIYREVKLIYHKNKELNETLRQLILKIDRAYDKN